MKIRYGIVIPVLVMVAFWFFLILAGSGGDIKEMARFLAGTYIEEEAEEYELEEESDTIALEKFEEDELEEDVPNIGELPEPKGGIHIYTAFWYAIKSIFTLKIFIAVLLYALASIVAYLLTLGLGYLIGKEGGAGLIGMILGPLVDILITCFFLGSISFFILGATSDFTFTYAVENMGRLFIAGAIGYGFMLLLSICPFTNMLIGHPAPGKFWIALPIIIAIFTEGSLGDLWGYTFDFVFQNFIPFLGFLLLVFVLDKIVMLVVGLPFAGLAILFEKYGDLISMPTILLFRGFSDMIPIFGLIFFFAYRYYF